MKRLNGLVEANSERNLRGSIRTVAAARIAVRQWHLTDNQRTALQLRLRYPDATLTELAQMSGANKNQYWSWLRYALRKADRKWCRNCDRLIHLNREHCPHCRNDS